MTDRILAKRTVISPTASAAGPEIRTKSSQCCQDHVTFTVTFVVVVLGFLTFVDFGGVTFTVKEQVPVFTPLIFEPISEQYFFDAAVRETTTFEREGMEPPAFFTALATVIVRPFLTNDTFDCADGAGFTVAGLPAGGF